MIAIKKGANIKYYDPEAFLVAMFNQLTPAQQAGTFAVIEKIGSPCLTMEQSSIIRPNGGGPA